MACLLRLEVRFAKMFSVAKKIVICLVQVHLCIGKSKTVHFFQPRKIFLILCGSIVQFLTGFLIVIKVLSKRRIINYKLYSKRDLRMIVETFMRKSLAVGVDAGQEYSACRSRQG